MQHKTVVITGASDGIGLAAARALKEMGATVVLVGRSPGKTRKAATELNAPYYVADFSRLAEVRKLATQLQGAYPHIDVFVNNAGGIFAERTLTEDGYEMTMQVNHLAPFLLTNLLIDTLVKSKATIINTSSYAAELFAKFDIDDLNMKKGYTARAAYGNAKLENILFTKELHRRYGSRGISAVAFHPGNVRTNFASSSKGIMRHLYQTPLKYLAGLISSEKGADTLVWLATTQVNKDWTPGLYYVKRKPAKTHVLADDTRAAVSLWEQSTQMTK